MRHLWYRRLAAKFVQLMSSVRRRTGAVAGVLVLGAGGLIVVLPASPAEAAAPSCTGATGHYYGAASSGTINDGTAAKIWTWTHWSVNMNNPDDFSNESVWSIDNNNSNDSFEVGFMSGHGFGDLGGGTSWTNGMVPYYTEDDGVHAYYAWTTFLPTDTFIDMFAEADDSGSLAYVNGQLSIGVNYVVSQPRLNLTQGEVYDNTGITMGGGSGGDSSTLYWIDSSGNDHYWTVLNDCADAPYWASSSEPYFFANGGPGGG